MGDDLDPIDLGTGRTATAIAAGSRHSCALLDDSTVKCWGDNGNGQLGQGDDEDRGNDTGHMGDDLPAVDLGPGRTATAITADQDHTCAVLGDGSVKCWGSNTWGKLGQGDTDSRGDDADEMGADLDPVDLGTGRTAVGVTAGDDHTCALLDDDSIRCWGRNYDGQLGIGDQHNRGDHAGELGDDLPTVDLGAGRTAQAVSAGGEFTCALLDDDSTKCWGANGSGQLGQGHDDDLGDDGDETGDGLPAVELGSAGTPIALASGEGQNCVILDATPDVLKCWGLGAAGALGSGDSFNQGDEPGEMGDSLAVVDLGTGLAPFRIGVGDRHSCAVLTDASLKCWGNNGFGQLGLEDSDVRGDGADEMGDNLPAIDLGTGRTAKRVEGGDFHTCAILDNDTVKCWGAIWSGRVGLELDGLDNDHVGDEADEMGDDLDAVDLGTGRTATAIGVGDSHSCALLDDDTVKCWGNSTYGQLGQESDDTLGDGANEMGDDLDPIDFGTGRTVAQLAVGDYHNCAILDNDDLKCWGRNTFGQLGLESVLDQGDDADEMGDDLDPVDLGAGRHAVRVSLGQHHTCAVLDDATVKCWGLGGDGQLGYGDQAARGAAGSTMGDDLPAVDLGAGRTAVAIEAGWRHTCALLDDDSIKCWGNNGNGSLGLGHTSTLGNGGPEMGDDLDPIEGVDLEAFDSTPAQPAPPTAALWVGDDTNATVDWTATPDDGGSAVTSYTLQSSTDGVSWTAESTTGAMTADVVDLVPGQEIWFRVVAANANGSSPPSLPSVSVKPDLFDPCPAGGHPFVDVPVTSFAFDDVGCIFQLGITTGKSATLYGPADLVTREQMAAFLGRLWRAMGSECPDGGHPFVDVPVTSFAFDDVGCIFQLGITTGKSATLYGPADFVTREQMAAFLARLWRALDLDCPDGGHPFVDVPVTSFAFDDVGCIFQLGITTGKSATLYGPADFVTREQMAAFLARLLRAAADELNC